ATLSPLHGKRLQRKHVNRQHQVSAQRPGANPTPHGCLARLLCSKQWYLVGLASIVLLATAARTASLSVAIFGCSTVVGLLQSLVNVMLRLVQCQPPR